MGKVVDFITGKVLCEGKDVPKQQYEFSKEAVMDVLVEIVEILEEEGYKFHGGVLILPNTNPDISPTSIGISTSGTAADMLKVMVPAMESVLHASEKEQFPSE